MRGIIVILLFLYPLIHKGQDRYGVIVDDDGYSNIRELPNLKSKIISNIFVGEVFKYSENKTNWLSIKTYLGIEGFIHKSRVKELLIDSAKVCSNRNLDLLFLLKKNDKIISVCGNSISSSTCENLKCFSMLVVYDVLQKEKLLEFDEGSFQTFTFAEGNLIVKEYAGIPINEEYKISFVPYSVNKVLFVNEKMVIVQNAPFYKYPKLPKSEVKNKISELKKNKIQEKDFYDIINISLVLALNDLKEGKYFLFNLSDELGIIFDGEYAEKYNEVLTVFKINENNR